MRLIKAQRTAGTSVRIWGRDEDGKWEFEAIGFRPFIYVSEDEAIPKDRRITEVEHGHSSIFGDKLVKLYLSNPSDAPEIRAMFKKHWEADIPYSRRFLISNRINSHFKVLHISSVSDSGALVVHVSDIVGDVEPGFADVSEEAIALDRDN